MSKQTLHAVGILAAVFLLTVGTTSAGAIDNYPIGAERVVVYVHNSSNESTTLHVDGVYHGEVPANDYVTVPTTIGSHTFRWVYRGIVTARSVNITHAYQTVEI